MSEDIFFVGKLNDLTDPQQLEELWAWMMKMQGRLNQFDPNSFSLAWIEGATAGQVIQSMGTGVAPVWESAPLLTGLTLSGLTASQVVVTDGSKALASSTAYQATSAKDQASGYAGLNASSRTTKGVDTTDDVIVNLATKGLVLKDTQGTPHYWRVTVDNSGALVISDLGTTKP